MEVEYDKPGRFCRGVARCGGRPLCVAVLVSLIVCVLFGWGDRLHPNLSLNLFQALSLFGVIVGAYLSFRMVRPKAWVQLRLNPRINPQPTLYPEVENKTDRFLHGKMEVRVWVAGPAPEDETGEDPDPEEFKPVGDIGEGGFYRGERFFPIRGRERPNGYLPLEDYLEFDEGLVVSRELRVRFDAKWIDAGLCEWGETTKYWRIDFAKYDTESPIDPDRIENLFEPLKDSYDADERGR